MKLALISERSQYDAFLRCRDSRSFDVVCDNPRFEGFLKARGVRHRLVSEYDIRGHWQKINRWGCEVACEAIRLGREHAIFQSIDMASVIYHHFSRTLIHIRKNHALAEFLLNRYDPEILWLPEQLCDVYYPDFSGNYFLRYFLEKLARQREISIVTTEVRSAVRKGVYLEDRRPIFQKWRGLLLDHCKRIFGGALARGSFCDHRDSVLAYGGLNHLSPVILELKSRGNKVVLFTDLFQKPWGSFSKNHQIPYFQSAHFLKKDNAPDRGWAEARKVELLRMVRLLNENQLFRPEGYDYYDDVTELVVGRIDGYLKNLSQRYGFLESLFAGLRPRACLTHDDFSLTNGFMAGFARERKIPVFCISHATLPLDFSVPLEKRAFCQSITFVNSQFEKDMYGSRGWVGGESIRVTGVPRYDRLLKMAEQRKPLPKVPSRLLYCASGLWDHSPNQRGYLGCEITLYRQVQLPAFLCMVNALKGLPVEVVIKPHSHIAIPLWKDLVKRQGRLDFKITVCSHETNIFQLYFESHAMLVPYWSTALIETAMIGLPTFFIDPQPPYSQALYDYAKNGFCVIVQNEGELRDRVKSLQLEGGGESVLPASKVREYYLGMQIPLSSRKVAEVISQN